MIDMLECTLWQRQLASLPEETVGALVAQVGGRDLSFSGTADLGGTACVLRNDCFLQADH